MTKLWNATRLVVDRGGRGGEPPPPPETLGRPLDRVAHRPRRWTQASALLGGLTSFSALADLVYHLIFDDFCDWYLELLKAGEATPEVAGARRSSSSWRWPTR